MKTQILALLTILILTISCKKEEKKLFLPTKYINVENINFQLPNDFNENGVNKWLFEKDKKIASIEINKNESVDLNSAIEELKSQKMEPETNKYTLIESKKGDTLNKKYVLETYKFNHSNYVGGYPVYSYETFSAIEINHKILTIYSFSLGFNLNNTMKKSIQNIK